MQLQVLPDERFTCRSCTECCRHQYVELFAGEAEKIGRLRWGDGDPLKDVKGIRRHGGKNYLAHLGDGACVFLNQGNGLCRIHEVFGFEAKPLACRLFPFQIVPTFDGEGVVSGRYDCPTVRRNEGEGYEAALPLVRGYTDRQPENGRGSGGFDEVTCCHLDRDQIAAVAEFVGTMMGGFDRNEERAIFIVHLCDILAMTAADQIDRPALASVYGPLKEHIKTVAGGPAKKLGLIQRMAFRTILALHLRRDEDVLDGRASRFGRLVAMILFVFGFGSFRGLGLCHPAGSLRAARLFERGPEVSVETFALLWRLVRNKLDSFGFMGVANGNRDFLGGLRSLALLYPLVMAAAKHHAASRRSSVIDASDVDYGVAVIEHSFGRSAILGAKFVRSMEKVLLERGACLRGW